MKLEWKEEYGVGVEEINNQHKKIIGFINELDNSTHSDNAKEGLTATIDNLNDYAKFHFATEEKYFDQFDYEDKEDHKKRHHDYMDKVIDFEKKVAELNGGDAIKLAFEMLDFLEDWWVGHILHKDKEYTKTFNDNGLV
jgi:hemerythrin-like metal-binding protein